MGTDDGSSTFTVPGWAKSLVKYAVPVLAVAFGFWLTVHDMQKDFVLEREKVVKLEGRVGSLEAARAAAAVRQTEVHTKLSSDLEYTKGAMDRMNRTLERLAQQ